jgi:hypothetical protein
MIPVKTMNRFRSESGCQISELLTNHFFDAGALRVLFGWHWWSEKIHFFYGKCGIRSSNVEINCVLCGWHWGPDCFHRFDGNGPSHLPILCAIYGEHRRSAYFHTPGSTSGNSPIYCQERTLLHFDSFADVLSSTVLIIAVDFSRISALNHILPGHQFVQSGRYRLTLEDFTCPATSFLNLIIRLHTCLSVHKSWCRGMSLIMKFFVMTPLSFL